MIHRTHIAVRLGDNLAHLHFLRKLAEIYPDHEFIHYAHLIYVRELSEVVCDMPNIKVLALESVDDHSGGMWDMKPHARLNSVDAWKNAGGIWESSMIRNDYARFMLVFFKGLAERMGLISPLFQPEDLLFDYPALWMMNFPPFDVLVVNSQPMSNQVPLYNMEAMEALISELSKKWKVVTTARTSMNTPCTMTKCMSVTQIGALSRFCRYIVMVSTGPSWPTLNVWTAQTCERRIILNGDERVDYSPNTDHASCVSDARKILQLREIL
jgi:hypothetical protein